MTIEIEVRADSPKPYGDVTYADEKNGKYPIDTHDHAKAALSYFSMPKNQEGYSPDEVETIMGRIKAACKKFGIEVADDNMMSQRTQNGPVEERAATVNNVDFAQRVITLLAVPYEQPTQVEYRSELWNEVFSRSSFNGIETRQRRIPVSTVLHAPSFDHNNARLVGKIISADPGCSDGLLLEAQISRTPAGDETLQLASDDAISPSVGFVSRAADHRLDRQTMTRRINRAFLDHLSFVPQPAYSGAKVLAIRAEGAPVERMSPIVTPGIDEYFSDPVVQWVDDRLSH